MKLRILFGIALSTGLALLPTTASAKGALSARITGPGLSSPIHIPLGSGVSELAGATGLYSAAFGNDPAPVHDRPAGKLGPRYLARYDFGIGPRARPRVRQDVYPFASAGPVTYTAPRQRIWSESPTRTRGGWFYAGPELIARLVSLGVPAPKTKSA